MFYVWFDDLNEWRLRVFGRTRVPDRPEPPIAVPSPEPAPSP
jgi:hypothetical protein